MDIAIPVSDLTPVLAATLPHFLMPIWLLSVGVTVAVAVFAVFLGILWVVDLVKAPRDGASGGSRLVRGVFTALSESVLVWFNYLCLGLVVFNLALVGWSLLFEQVVPVRDLVSSVGRTLYVGSDGKSTTVAAGETNQKLDIQFRADELIEFTISSNQDISISIESGEALSNPLLLVEGGTPYQWQPGGRRPRGFETGAVVDAIYIGNTGNSAAKVDFTYSTDVIMPEVYGIAKTAIVVLVIYGVYSLLHWLLPGISVIAITTAKEAVSQPIYVLLTIIGAVLLIVFIYIPYNTFGEDVKMLKMSGLTLIMILAIIIALWTASVSISEEIEGRTALTVLSKPISRRQFILGKFLGIVWPVLLMFLLLGFVLLVAASYKVQYDWRETSKGTQNWQLCYYAMISTVPGLILSFFEAVVLAAISVALSTRLSMLPNLLICASIYVLGHLGPLIAMSSAGKLVFVQFVGQLIAIVLPVLDHFNVQAAITSDQSVPLEYIAWAGVYTALYCGIMMLLALLLFEDRDLA